MLPYLPPVTKYSPFLDSEKDLMQSGIGSEPMESISPAFTSFKMSHTTILLAFELDENKNRPLLLNCMQLIPSMLFYSLYLPTLPSVLKSIRLIELSSRPIAMELTLSGMKRTDEIPQTFLSKTLRHGCFILMSQILTCASLAPLARMLPSLLKTSSD